MYIRANTVINQTVEHNSHGDVALQRGVRNVLTISGQRAYHSHPVALVSHQGNDTDTWILTCSDPLERQNVGTGMQT